MFRKTIISYSLIRTSLSEGEGGGEMLVFRKILRKYGGWFHKWSHKINTKSKINSLMKKGKTKDCVKVPLTNGLIDFRYGECDHNFSSRLNLQENKTRKQWSKKWNKKISTQAIQQNHLWGWCHLPIAVNLLKNDLFH